MIIAFYSPYPGAGKTTAAEYIKKTRPEFAILSFADTLRDIVGSVFYKTHHDNAAVYTEKDFPRVELGGHSYRDFLLAFGAAGRRLCPNIWVDCLKYDIESYMRDVYGIEGVVIDDLRFPNEYAMLREKGARIIRITNPGREIVPSEAEALLEGWEFDAQLVNDPLRGPEHYHAQLDALIATLWPEKDIQEG
ncbi:MAG: hypothetical protein K6E38_00205 [Fretibacterium sp.]|nr:hypothetical protein [Fretibacterium sp.]